MTRIGKTLLVALVATAFAVAPYSAFAQTKPVPGDPPNNFPPPRFDDFNDEFVPEDGDGEFDGEDPEEEFPSSDETTASNLIANAIDLCSDADKKTLKICKTFFKATKKLSKKFGEDLLDGNNEDELDNLNELINEGADL